MPDAAEVRAMFGRIAGRYDLLNRLLSGGVDRRWRAAAVRRAEPLAGRLVVDACAGTGDLSLAFARRGARVLGVDFTPEMVARAARRRPLAGGGYARGDALALPVRSGSADVASVAFGLRNVADRRRALAEMARVVRPGGLVLVLEFAMPRARAARALYRAYFTRVLPRVGGWVSGEPDAYRYLPDTVLAWPPPDELEREMGAAGLVELGHRLLTGGIAALHFGRRPA